jgi:phosphoribosylglycinamide formyltransferase-1
MTDQHNPESPLRLGIITYDHAHLKTEQLVDRFLLKNRLKIGRKLELILLALPFSSRQSRTVLFAHRPDQEKSVGTRELAARHQLELLPCDYDSIPDVADVYLIAGAGIFSPKAIGKKKIINVHPGIIPSARGLDAFKWSILDDVPLGVTLHCIDAEVDAGETIAVVETPIFPSDTMEVLARRHYELELDVACEFLSFLRGKAEGGSAAYPEKASRMRMPVKIERDMIAKFDEYKRKHLERAAAFDHID